jgi:hypothetical protein
MKALEQKLGFYLMKKLIASMEYYSDATFDRNGPRSLVLILCPMSIS